MEAKKKVELLKHQQKTVYTSLDNQTKRGLGNLLFSLNS